MNPKDVFSILAGDFLRIHRAITRALTVGIRSGLDYMKDGFPDQGQQQGFVLYLQTLSAVLSAHHLGEDEVAFPELKQKIPAAPYEKLAVDHLKIETMLDHLKNSLADMSGENSTAALGKVVESLQRIQAKWIPHITMEQTAFAAEAIDGVMTMDEQIQLSTGLSKHAQEHAGAPFYALPFVLFNLEIEDRAEMAAHMPKMVIEELIPGEWKEKWMPMKPFLLD